MDHWCAGADFEAASGVLFLCLKCGYALDT